MLPDGSRGKKKKPAIAFRPADLLPPGWVKLITSVHVLEGYNGSLEEMLPYAIFPRMRQGSSGTTPRAAGIRAGIRPSRRRR
jgi:pyruvate/oxaloacetate carboxyltransferase